MIYETRLLGVILTSNLSWSSHVTDICKRATQKLWVLIRFKSLGGTRDQLITVYQTRVRSTLEFAAPVFNSGLTKEHCREIEMVQKKALAIILGRSYTSYESALTSLNAWISGDSFALKYTKSERHKPMFPLNKNFRQNSAHADGVLAPFLRTPSLRSAPNDVSGNFPAHVSAESPSNISPNPSEDISEVSEP